MRLDAFAAFRTQKVNFVDDSNVKKRKTPTIKWVKDGRSGLRYIRVVPDKKNKVNVDSINLFLATEHLKLIESKEDCSNGNDKGVYENEVEVHFLNERFLSYSLTIHSACLGARLQSITTHHTFDITTGKEYKLEDLYWFGDEEKPEIRHGGQEWYQYRYKVFGSKVLSLLMESHPEIFESLQVDCPNITEKYWRFPDWYLTTEGLYLVGKNTFKNKDCMVETQWSVLPWDTIESFYVGPEKQVK